MPPYTGLVIGITNELQSRPISIISVSDPAPGRARRQPLDIALVVDTSGSMGGRKIVQARAAAHYLLSVLTADEGLPLPAD